MKLDKLLQIKSKGYSKLNSRAKPSNLDNSEVANLDNMIYSSTNDIVIRNGSSTFKSNGQWGEVAVIEGKGYELNESGAEVGCILEDGRFFYIKVADYSETPRTELFPDKLWVEVPGIGAGPLLNVTDKNKVFWRVVNNDSFFCDGTNQLTYLTSDHIPRSVPDPVGFEIRVTVDVLTAAQLDAQYTDGTRNFFVTKDKVSGVGTTLILRQFSGDGRPDNLATFTNVLGAGDLSINSLGIEYSDRFISLAAINGRLVAISDQGYIWISETNDGTDFNGPQAERLLYGKEDGLSVKDAFAFARSVILNLNNAELRKAASASLTGNIRPDPDATLPQNPEDFLKIQRESNRIAVYGRSGQEVNSGFVGLSRDGFIFVSTENTRREFGINNRESISGPIQNLVNAINFKNSDDIRATIDEESQRYVCAAPIYDSLVNNILFVYDFDNSTFAVANAEAQHKWALFSYNIGGAGITSLFTIFGVPFLGLSDGRIIQTEISNKYEDPDGVYKSGFRTKAFDFEARSWFKNLKVALFDLTIDSKMRLSIYPLIDEFSRLRDYNGKFNNVKKLEPISLATDDLWSSNGADIWTQSPIDIWGQISAERYSFINSKSIPKFQEISFVIENVEGGKKWGSYGFELYATLEDEFFDGRLGANINVDDQGLIS